MTRLSRSILLACISLGLALAACGSDDASTDSNNDNNGWIDQDVSTDAGDDASSGDASSGDAGTDAQPDATLDTGTDAGSGTPFTAEGLASAPWYAVSPLTSDPAITGAMFEVEFDANMSVSLGFRDEVTGSWSFFGEERVRLSELEQENGEPNQPTQLVLDADLDGDGNVEGLELLIPDSGGGAPYVMRFEQPDSPEFSVEELAGNWQSEQTYTDENSNPYRIVLRMLADTAGYGIYNGAYVEFIGGTAMTITYDTGESFWFSVPPSTGDPVPALAGQIVVDDAGETVLYAPRETQPQSGEFEAIKMNHVESFDLPEP